MTWLKIIFPFYILLLVTMPCADNCSIAENEKADIHSTKEAHHHSDKEEEACSSFCFCACCGIQTTRALMQEPGFACQLIIPSPKNSIYKFSIQSVLYNVWQPPKLS